MSIEKKISKFLDNYQTESEDGAMGYLTAHPHGGRGRIGRNKGITCPHCGKTIDLRKIDKE